MISLLAFVVFAPAHVIELIEPKATEISIQALIKLPDLGAKDLAKLGIIAQTIPKQTQAYPRREMLTVTAGVPVRCTIDPDIVRIVVSVPPDKLKSGLSLMESLIQDATLTQENLDAAALELAVPDYWSAALNPIALPSVKLTSDEAQVLYKRVFRPERIQLVVGGSFAKTEAISAWSVRMDHWTPAPESRGYFDITPTQERTHNTSSVTTIDLVGAPIPSSDASLSARLLALFALGTGKGASLFRIVREKYAWSYRQEAILSPTRDGWVPRLLIASIPTDVTADRVKTIKNDLMDDVKSWTEASRARALGMAEAVFKHDVPFSPLYVLGASPVGNSLEARTFMAGYWPLKTGTPWDPDALLAAMKKTSLDDLKDQASAILTSAIPRVLPGN